MDRDNDFWKEILEILEIYDNDPVVYRLRNILVNIQFHQVDNTLLTSYEFDENKKELITVGSNDYSNKTRIISEMLYNYTKQYYPELFIKESDLKSSD
jgi:hypothetical protein